MTTMKLRKIGNSSIHAELLAEHGGLLGHPTPGALEATLARAPHRFLYTEPKPSLAELAAAYGCAPARDHCFPDGNKHLALAIMDVFLQLNGYELIAEEVDAATTVLALAAGELTEAELTEWVKLNVRALGP
jgi:death on curing protein